VVQGTENTPSNMYTQRMHETQKHLTVSNHGYLGYAVIVNKKFWDGLPAGTRRILERAMAEATAYEKTIAQRTNDEALEAIHTLSPQQQAEWRKAMAPVYARMEERIGKDLVQAIRREAGAR
jgi:C4-dicarboxylate-binding protein DctP